MSQEQHTPAFAMTGAPPIPPAATGGAGQVLARRKLMLFLLAVIYTLNYLDRQIVVILQEPIKADFGLADWQLGLVTGGAFGLFYTSLGIPIAQWIDRGINRVRLIAVLTAGWSVMTILCGITRNFGQFFLARMGVGLAEAGFTPAAHSLLSDMYPPRERPQAMGLFAIGVPVGIMAGLSLGGIVAQLTDWRTALFVAGAPGLIAAFLLPMLTREPLRGGMDDTPPAAASPVGFAEALRILARRRAFVHVLLGASVCSFAQAGVMAWLPSYLIRGHGMNLAEAGLSLGLLSGLCGMAGTVAGGWQATRFGGQKPQGMLWIPVAGTLAMIPLQCLALMAGSGQAMLLLMIVPLIFGGLWTAPSIALSQGLAPVAMRARASAIYVVFANLVGVSMGPLVLGILSDSFAALRGDAATGLRDALICVTFTLAWGALHLFLAARHLQRETRENAAGQS
ncbi:MFS transporter [Caenibius sp. WL]|uniref:spinster family MFS transporter n=1 Tax=Caenibius sp. WL TaxID=2872646 RepID=UPI001C995B1C|nr:MFS transporter [Caenibius sp. WL]QZP09068.1 MFS transporter [Caenibius sp. WL]